MTDRFLLTLENPWATLESLLAGIAEGASELIDDRQFSRLHSLGLVDGTAASPALSEIGRRYYLAKYVHEDKAAARDVLGELLQGQSVPITFCATLWGSGSKPVAGALRLLRQITKSPDDTKGRRWLTLMNSGGLLTYNQKSPTLRIAFNPNELTAPDEADARERVAGHVLSPETPYTNLMVLKQTIRAARGFLWWYEQHMPAKVLEVLMSELDGEKVTEVRILSGPANITDVLKGEFGRFVKEMAKVRGIAVSWRVLSKEEAFKRHDRILLSQDMAKNLPPVNTMLAGSVGEILPSGISTVDFETWWKLGTDLAAFQVPAAVAK